jgi:hypothetical protein
MSPKASICLRFMNKSYNNKNTGKDYLSVRLNTVLCVGYLSQKRISKQ